MPTNDTSMAGSEAARVYLVATGETHEGAETYTRHDTRPPLCDAEVLYTHPLPVAQAQAGAVAEAPDLIARGMGWEECEQHMREACAQAGVQWDEEKAPQSIAINVMQRLANAAHKTGFKLALSRLAAPGAALDAREQEALAVDCPHCWRKAGEPCIWPETRERNRDAPHEARKAEAERLALASRQEGEKS